MNDRTIQEARDEGFDDAISRKTAIDALADYIHNVDKVYSTGKLSAYDCKDAAWSVLGDLPSVPPKKFHVIDIITGKEADPYNIALNEDWAKRLIYCDMEGFAIEEDGSLILVDECGQFEYCPIGRFEVVWDA